MNQGMMLLHGCMHESKGANLFHKYIALQFYITQVKLRDVDNEVIVILDPTSNVQGEKGSLG
jgi:hypothetical protein